MVMGVIIMNMKNMMPVLQLTVGQEIWDQQRNIAVSVVEGSLL